MPSLTDWKVPAAVQPRVEDYSFDLERALSAMVGVHSIIPPDAFSAETLGTERAGNGVLIEITENDDDLDIIVHPAMRNHHELQGTDMPAVSR